jgi:hypothetical protein
VLSVVHATLVKAFNLEFEIIPGFKFFLIFLKQETFTIVLFDDLLHLDIASVLFELLTTIRGSFELSMRHLKGVVSMAVFALNPNFTTFCSQMVC